MNIIKVWTLVNLWTGVEVKVEAVGPRDAIMAMDGWQEVRKVGDWLVGRSWKVFLDSVWRERYEGYR